MISETKIWSIITVLALSTLLVLVSQELGAKSDSSNSDSNDFIALESTADTPDPLSKECVDHSGLGRQ